MSLSVTSSTANARDSSFMCHELCKAVPNCWVSVLQVAQPSMNPLVFKIFTSVLRTGNNVVGGISFVTLAKLFGVQSSKGDEVKQVAQQHHIPAEKAEKKV